ncbi:hypothetical protein BASA81_005165 [Batrachochytrium salamandrivorans]|nr:hypothetical protein BASA81_005165 [Batrachochytrium salamandrivorans]
MALLLLLACSQVWGYASDQVCSGSSSWIRDHVYGEMSVPKYSTSTTSCRLTIEPNLGFYLPNQEFKIKVTPSDKMGIKIAVGGDGGEFTSVSSGGKIPSGEKYCVDYDKKQTGAEMTFRAPAMGGKLIVRAICGTKKVMHVADEIVIEPGEGVLPVPLVFSTDPRYSFERQLHSTVVMRHTRNATHFSLALEYTKTGYISFGIGRVMVPSVALIAVNPESNPGMPSVGLYQLINKDKTGGNIPIDGSMETKAGIVESSYEELSNGHSMLRFTQLLTMIDPTTDLPAIDLMWAVGPAKYGMHKECGTVLDLLFASGKGGRRDETETPTARDTLAPTPQKTLVPTARDTLAPTPQKTLVPTVQDTLMPTASPTALPTIQETLMPTTSPTALPAQGDEIAVSGLGFSVMCSVVMFCFFAVGAAIKKVKARAEANRLASKQEQRLLGEAWI